jgi:adenosine kinase
LNSNSNSRVLVTGSLAFDFILTYPGKFQDHILPDKLHMINVSFLVDKVKKQRGGVAGNIAYTMALMGEKSRVLAAAGHDFQAYKEFLDEQGVDTQHIMIAQDEMTATCFITTDMKHNQITGFYTGAMTRASELSVKESLGGAEYVIVSPDDPEAMKRHCREAKDAGCVLIYDPSFQVLAMDGDFLWEGAKGAKALILNDYEFSMFCEKTGKSVDELHEEIEVLVVTLGDQGSRVMVRGGPEIQVKPVNTESAVDPTGCGDAYRGGFLTGLVNGCSYEECGQLGSVASVFVVEQYGTQSHHYTPGEFAERYKENYGNLPEFLKEASLVS